MIGRLAERVVKFFSKMSSISQGMLIKNLFLNFNLQIILKILLLMSNIDLLISYVHNLITTMNNPKKMINSFYAIATSY